MLTGVIAPPRSDVISGPKGFEICRNANNGALLFLADGAEVARAPVFLCKNLAAGVSFGMSCSTSCLVLRGPMCALLRRVSDGHGLSRERHGAVTILQLSDFL